MELNRDHAKAEGKPHCSYCDGDTHDRAICPREAFNKIEPEYLRLKAECIEENCCMRSERQYRPGNI
jgi:hypothetical protein